MVQCPIWTCSVHVCVYDCCMMEHFIRFVCIHNAIVYVYMYVCMYNHCVCVCHIIHTFYVRVYLYVHVCMYVCMYMYVCTCMYMYVHVVCYVCTVCMHTHVYTCTLYA